MNPGVIDASQVNGTDFKIGQTSRMYTKSAGAQSSNELQRLVYMIGYQYSNKSNGCQGDMPYCTKSLARELM